MNTPILIDQRCSPSLREILGALLSRATEADFAIARIRLDGIDLAPGEIATVRRCRVLVGRIDADTLSDAAYAAGDPDRRRHLEVMYRFIESGRLEVRAASFDAWSPDFSVLRGVTDASTGPDLVLVGAHYFARPHPSDGPAFTCVIPGGAAARRAAARFEEIWSRGYDVLPVLRETLARVLRPGPPGGGNGGYLPSRNSVSDRLLGMVRERAPAWAPATPRAVALDVLAARFPDAADAPDSGDGPVFDLACFQADAVRRAEEILAVRRGVLIADSVGLGKTFVALALVERVLRRGGRAAVVAPAALRRDWCARLRRLARALGVRDTWGLGSDGGPNSARVLPGEGESGPRAGPAAPPGAFLAWLSHTALSRGTHRPDRLQPLDLIVVDEAHAFRSPHTRRYRALAELCRGTRVVLLTATPVNNSLMDLYFQLRLFAGDGAFRDVGVADLGEAFRAAAAGEGGAAPPSLLPVLRAVMIRRTRPFLREHYRGVRLPGGAGAPVLTFPCRAPPRPVRYTLEDAYPGLFPEMAAFLEALTLAPLRLADYGAPLTRRTTGGEAELVRLVLLKRLESSLAAFRASIVRQVRFYDAFLAALGRGRLLAAAEDRALYAGGDADVAQLVLEEMTLRPIPPGLDVDRLAADARADLVRLSQVARRLAGFSAECDPKLARLRELLDGELRGAKVVLFTEFRETARYLWRTLVSRGGVALVDGEGAFLGQSPCGRREVIERFAPRANRSGGPMARDGPTPPPRERVDLLIATDVLAEGLNLHDADRVISYDLPWNPVRLIQRVGRVDRLGSPHPVIHAYHFLPDRGLDALLGLVARLRAKLAAIGRTVGAEGAVLDAAEEVDPGLGNFVDRLAAGDPEVLDEIERADAAPFELGERLRAAYRAARQRPGEASAAAPGPRAAALPAPPGERHRVLLAYSIGGKPLWLVADPETGEVTEDEDAAAQILLRALEAPMGESASVSPEAIGRALAAARRVLATRSALAGATEPLPPHSPGARAARRLLAALAAVPGGPDPTLCRRADRLMAVLARRHDAGTEAAIRAALQEPRGRPDSEAAPILVEALERALGTNANGVQRPGSPALAAPGGAPHAVRLIGVLEVRPAADRPPQNHRPPAVDGGPDAP